MQAILANLITSTFCLPLPPYDPPLRLLADLTAHHSHIAALPFPSPRPPPLILPSLCPSMLAHLAAHHGLIAARVAKHDRAEHKGGVVACLHVAQVRLCRKGGYGQPSNIKQANLPLLPAPPPPSPATPASGLRCPSTNWRCARAPPLAPTCLGPAGRAETQT